MAVAVRIDGGQSKFDVTIGSNRCKRVDNHRGIGILFTKITCQDRNRIIDLCRADVFGAIFMNDVKHHGDDVDLGSTTALRLCRLALFFQRLRSA